MRTCLLRVNSQQAAGFLQDVHSLHHLAHDQVLLSGADQLVCLFHVVELNGKHKQIRMNERDGTQSLSHADMAFSERDDRNSDTLEG